MHLPKIDLSALPNLDTLTGVFGSLADIGRATASDDTVLVIATFIYEISPPPDVNPGGLFF